MLMNKYIVEYNNPYFIVLETTCSSHDIIDELVEQARLSACPTEELMKLLDAGGYTSNITFDSDGVETFYI